MSTVTRRAGRRAFTASLLLAAGLLLGGAAHAQGAFYLHDGDRVVFYGDSITDQRLYTTFVEEYVVSRFPHLKVSFVHSGWGGDRVTGGGGGPIDLRLKRDVIAYRPTVMTIMLAMNDAGYRPFDDALYKTYTTGYEHIIQTVKDALPNLRITVIQPSPFDDVTRAPGFAGGYNGVLIKYGDFVKDLGQRDGLTVADLNTPVVAMLERAKAQNPELAQKIIPDRVHPGPGGHLVMAEAILKAWNAPATVSSVEIDAAGKKVANSENTAVTGLTVGDGVTWTQVDNALPMPLDLKDPVVDLVLHSSDFVEAMDQELLKITGLTGPRYILKIDGEEAGSFTPEQLAAGINLALLPTPMEKQADMVADLTRRHNDLHFQRWRQFQVPLQNDRLADMPKALAGLDAVEGDIVAQQHQAARPVPHHYELAAAPAAP